MLGLSPLLGRGFEPEDEQVGGQNDVVMLTERFWRIRFGGSPSVIGATLQLDGRARTIIGVMPDHAWPQPNVSVFVPLLLASVALPACWLPARRAARVDPMAALRTE